MTELECRACSFAAVNPYAIETNAGCLQCAVRLIANAPDWRVRRFLDDIEDAEERAAFRTAVELEQERQRELAARWKARGAG